MSCKRRTTCCQSWEKEFQYLRKAGSGISHVHSHMSGPTHLERKKQLKNQVIFSRSAADDDGAVVMNTLRKTP